MNKILITVFVISNVLGATDSILPMNTGQSELDIQASLALGNLELEVATTQGNLSLFEDGQVDEYQVIIDTLNLAQQYLHSQDYGNVVALLESSQIETQELSETDKNRFYLILGSAYLYFTNHIEAYKCFLKINNAPDYFDANICFTIKYTLVFAALTCPELFASGRVAIPVAQRIIEQSTSHNPKTLMRYALGIYCFRNRDLDETFAELSCEYFNQISMDEFELLSNEQKDIFNNAAWVLAQEEKLRKRSRDDNLGSGNDENGIRFSKRLRDK